MFEILDEFIWTLGGLAFLLQQVFNIFVIVFICILDYKHRALQKRFAEIDYSHRNLKRWFHWSLTASKTTLGKIYE